MRFRPLLILLVMASVIAGTYWFGHARGERASSDQRLQDIGSPESKASSIQPAFDPSPLPARDTPLKRAFPELTKRAAAGDAIAASRLYRDLRLCGSVDGLDWWSARLADELLDDKVDASDAQSIDRYRVQLDGIESRKEIVRRYRELCAGVDDAMLDARWSAMERAAQLGDEDARACYLMRGPGYDARGLMRHPEWIADYRSNVDALVQAGLSKGDWKVVDLLRSAYQPGSETPLSGVLGPDPSLHYRYLKLYRLGAESTRITQIDRQVTAAAARLTPAQQADADRWAQTHFDRDFGNRVSTATTAEGWDPCSLSVDPL